MATQTLLQIITDASVELGLTPPTTVVGSTINTVARMLAMSNAEGADLAESADWTVLQRLHSFATVASTDEYALPSDYSRLLHDTEWDRTTAAPIVGPLTPQVWQTIKSGSIGSVTASNRYRIMRSTSATSRKFVVDPTPSAVETLVFEYISNGWCSNAAGSSVADVWAADTDLSLLDHRLMVLGVIVRFKRSVGLDFASEADEYAQVFTRKKAQDRPAPSLSIANRRLSDGLISTANLPETISL